MSRSTKAGHGSGTDEKATEAASNAIVPQTKAALLVENNAAADLFAEYAEARDEVLGTPYAPNKALARSGTPFTIVRAVEGTKIGKEGMSRAGETIETYLYLIALQGSFASQDETTLEETVFDSGSILKLEMERLAGPRGSDYEMVTKILAEHPNGIANMALQEYPAMKKGRSNSYGLIDAKRWRTVTDVARERGMIKE